VSSESSVNFSTTIRHYFQEDGWLKLLNYKEVCYLNKERPSSCHLLYYFLFNAQHVSEVNTSILRSLRLIRWVTSWVVLFWFDVCWCYVVVWLWCCGIRMQAEASVLQPAYGYHTTPAKLQRNTNTHRTRWNIHEITQQISRKLLRMDLLTSETCWALNNEIIKQVTSSWSLYSTITMMHGPINIKYVTDR